MPYGFVSAVSEKCQEKNVEQHIMVLPNESAKESFLTEMLPVPNEVGRIIAFVSTRVKCEVHSRRWVDTTVSMVFFCMGGVVSWWHTFLQYLRVTCVPTLLNNCR